MVEKTLAELDLASLRANRQFFPSPIAWEDQILYFLMLDRFSDGKENGYKDNQGNIVKTGKTPIFTEKDAGNAIKTPEDAQRWREAGVKWVGGNLQGLTSKIGYLKRLGVTALWVSPIFKQVSFYESYHGYGIQNFLDVDPNFGTREDLKTLVETAHQHGIYVILDIILNHAGDIFSYETSDPYWPGPYPVKGFNDKEGKPTISFGRVNLEKNPEAWPDGAIWPAEFQDHSNFTQKGYIRNWDNYPEYVEGDFFSLKDIRTGQGSTDFYEPSVGLLNLCEVYKFWIAYADIDGFRVDTVKHMERGATRYFAEAIHEFSQLIGKENFYLIGEITGGRQNAYSTLDETGLDAALGISEIPDKLAYLVKGYRDPSTYFSLFRNSLLINKSSHVWFRNKVVTMFDDHDQVEKGNSKGRFCAGENGEKVVLNALAFNALTLGIPCIYYGSEQCFNGGGDSDRYIREAMFGGEFGSFTSRDRHFFNEENQVYQELAKILEIRKQKITLRRGRQYLRPISGNGVDFGLPRMLGDEIRSVVPWSRLLDKDEIVVAINTDYNQPQTAWVNIDYNLHQVGDRFQCVYSTDKAQIGNKITVEDKGVKCFLITVPSAGFVIYERVR
ncbi:alpha-amylase family glycosyl hydrolase [Kamptonema sp. UHCC 0994]|uniref:alpha-amylase family glycosyl hydrolase n=1 Tax=Kamptonema sp. UHCC 0994 TaxID=3031329 RepID=UPI0023B8F075|nr:alpha-amylase family glycosyl hydrolase [Kamptonema sp. UHCC 0994]MDF0555234.1 alpha-amylase family glycosyl hydrolase [Kamptonema sp. UHCC 0994]